MLGSIQSGRCHLDSGLALAGLFGGRRTQGGGRSHQDWAMDSDLLRIGGVHGLVFPSMRFFPDRGELLRRLSAPAGSVVLLVERFVDFCRTPEVMEQDRQLTRHRDDGSLLSVLAAAGGDL